MAVKGDGVASLHAVSGLKALQRGPIRPRWRGSVCHGRRRLRGRFPARCEQTCAPHNPRGTALRNLLTLIHSALVLGTGIGGAHLRLGSLRKDGGWGWACRARRRSSRLPTLRFRGKIMLGFAVVLAISAASMGFCLSRLRAGLGWRGILSQQRHGSRSGAQYRPRTDLLSVAGAIFRGDGQRRRRQGGAFSRSRPQGRHRPVDEGHHQSGAARTGRPSLPANSASSPRSSPTS